jgi:hypothetical protein
MTPAYPAAALVRLSKRICERFALVAAAVMVLCAPAALAQTAGKTLAQILNPVPATKPGQSRTLLPDGRWLLLGGKNEEGVSVATALISDPKTNQTVTLGSELVQARTGHTATLMPDGSVLVVGGTLEKGAVTDAAERFDPATSQFQALPSLGLIPRAQHTATLLADGRLLVAGGVDARNKPLYDVELYNASTNQIESFNAKLDHARLNDLAALLPSNTVLLWGGVGADGTPLPGAELYDPAQARFLPFSAEAAQTLASALDTPLAPAAIASDPADGDTRVDVGKVLSLRFSKRLDVTTVNAQTIVLVGPSGSVDVHVTPVE